MFLCYSLGLLNVKNDEYKVQKTRIWKSGINNVNVSVTFDQVYLLNKSNFFQTIILTPNFWTVV